MIKNIKLLVYFSELKKRFLFVIISWFLTFCSCYFYSIEFIYLFVKPLLIFEKNFIFTNLMEAFYVYIKICIISSLLCCLPYIFYEIWCFIIPSCYFYEKIYIKKYIYWYLVVLVVSIYFIYFILLPTLYYFFISYEIRHKILSIKLEAKIDCFVNDTLKLFLFFLFLLQLPFISYILYIFSILDPYFLSKNRKHFFLFFIIFTAFLSPPEFLSQIIIFLFFFFFFEFIIYIGFLSIRYNL